MKKIKYLKLVTVVGVGALLGISATGLTPNTRVNPGGKW